MSAQRKPAMPTVGLLQGRPYTPAADTDIRKTFALFGWKPKEKQTCATTGKRS
jgi:hypothetical protein